MSDLDRMLASVGALSTEDKAQLSADVLGRTGDMCWVPNIGPQTDGFFSAADELFYGGQAGGGKSDLVVGLALTEHEKSLILRRFQDDADALAERSMEIIDDREGWNGQKHRLRYGKHVIDFGGVKDEKDKERYKGKPHDLIGFDEIPDFVRSQYEFIIAWNRSINPNQRCRIVAAGNPPTQAEGLWVVNYWGPWLHPLNPKYPYPDGELLWFTQDLEGNEIEVDGPGPHLIGGEPVMARSRTFIRAKLSDNPDLAQTNYDAVLSKLPKELRDAYRDGKFDMGLKDRPWQVVPSAWLREAQSRWQREQPMPMTAMGVDVAQGGEDQTVIARQHGWWFAPIVKIAGKRTPDGPSVAAHVIEQRRAAAEIVMDMGGGYGGSAYDHLKSNGIKVKAHKGNAKSHKKTSDRQLKFVNKRSEIYWRFREALDPGQPGGAKIALPTDPELFADLTALAWKVTPRGIEVTLKENLVRKLGRSPDAGDAVVMSFSAGDIIPSGDEYWREDQRSGKVRKKGTGIKVDMGRRKRRK